VKVKAVDAEPSADVMTPRDVPTVPHMGAVNVTVREELRLLKADEEMEAGTLCEHRLSCTSSGVDNFWTTEPQP
jgi:hypothetical protein